MILYKYLEPDRIDVLQKCRIRFTQPIVFNDPFESRPYFDCVTRDSDISSLVRRIEELPQYEWDNIDPKMRRDLSREQFIQEMKHDPSELVTLIKDTSLPERFLVKLLEDTSAELGVLSLSEKNDNLLMWAHYAKSHEGFVLGFDTTHSWFNQHKSPADPFNCPQKVRYSINRPFIAMLELSAQVILTKSIDWKYEQEWRIIKFLEEGDTIVKMTPYPLYPIYLFSFPPDCIDSIYFGVRMSEDNQIAMTELLRKNSSLHHIKLFRAVISKTDFRIEFQKC